MITRPFLLHALSPLHAGTGQAAEIVDLPTARMKGTGIPFIPGSSIKGVLREGSTGRDPTKTDAAFGPSANPDAHAGAIAVGDARLLALPVRSFRGTFAWVTSPLLLVLAQRDLKVNIEIPNDFGAGSRGARVSKGNICTSEGTLYLHDLDLPAMESDAVSKWSSYFEKAVCPTAGEIFSQRFVVVDDDTMSFLMETATQVDARIRIDPKTRTAAKGALWLEESLPPESLLIGLLASDRSRKEGVPMTPQDVLDFVLPDVRHLQFGGKSSTGKGRCNMVPLYESIN